MALCALYRSGRYFALESTGITRVLPQLLSESECQNVQTKAHVLEYVAGTVAGQNFYQDMMYGFQTGLPFFKQGGCASEDYDALYEQALIEMQQPDFRATWPMVTAWGTTPTA